MSIRSNKEKKTNDEIFFLVIFTEWKRIQVILNIGSILFLFCVEMIEIDRRFQGVASKSKDNRIERRYAETKTSEFATRRKLR